MSLLATAATIIISSLISYTISAITAKDSKINGGNINKTDNLDIQTSDYGTMIPIVYGTMRLSGIIIWCDEIKEHIDTKKETQKAKGGKRKVTTTTQEYNYTVSLAIALCEGPIDKINKCWADSKELNINSISNNTNNDYYTIYRGTEDQLPDPFIQALEGIDNTPAYRGIAYVVIKNFLLSEYGNRIPNFTFEVEKKNNSIDQTTAIQNKIKSICINNIGEFECDTEPVCNCLSYYDDASGTLIPKGKKKSINITDITKIPDSILSMNNLKETFINCSYISVNGNWFCDDILLDDNFTIVPKVEYPPSEMSKELNYSETYPYRWKVGDYTRETAKVLNCYYNYNNYNNINYTTTLNSISSSLYYGTSSDESLLRYLNYCRNELKLSILFNFFKKNINIK